MTTLLAIVAAILMIIKKEYLILILVCVLAIIQSYTARKMNISAARFMAEGLDVASSAKLVSNKLATINMVSSIGIWILFVVSLFV